MDLFYDVRLLRRIAPQCVEVLCSTGFSLCGFDFRLALRKAHRLKSVPLDRAGLAPWLLAREPASGMSKIPARSSR